jgi:hypothetical protein
MAWIKSHQDLEEHPKMIKLMKKTGWEKEKTIGFLHRFWWWVLKYAEDGDLKDYSNKLVADALGVPTAIIKLLYRFKWIDADRKVHNWIDYSGRYLWLKYHSQYPEKYDRICKKYGREIGKPKGKKQVNLLGVPKGVPIEPKQVTLDNRKGKDRKGKERNIYKEVNAGFDFSPKEIKDMAKEHKVKQLLIDYERVVLNGKKLTSELYPRQIGAIGRMKKAGYTENEIFRCMVYMTNMPFWKDKAVDFIVLSKQIHRIKQELDKKNPQKNNSFEESYRKTHGREPYGTKEEHRKAIERQEQRLREITERNAKLKKE